MEKFMVFCVSSLLLSGIVFSVSLGTNSNNHNNDNVNVAIAKEEEVQVFNENHVQILNGQRFETFKQDNLNTTLSINSQTGKEIIFHYKVTNIDKSSLNLRYTSNQKYEYKLYNLGKEKIDQYSFGKKITDNKSEIVLEPNESLSYNVEFRDLEKGDYLLTIWIPVVRGGESTIKKISFSVN
ncbi:BsuPI-related putative proteinase inhibitor [Bacillus sp. REN16]|uniref:BsuPI-related putative proteinase inhibitor n=1 Tax=Bacillus sp. REN16 TaxID=2887296 RepID=UPI001E52FDB6|nr:BsuPI-related putative proteinase inhibitor [Bacillus sp. REN16]MCC3356908.1 hypothetical protein [Bacillus sp. REN16]